MSNLAEMLSVALQASLGRHTARSLAATAKRIRKEKKSTQDFILTTLEKGEIKWKSLKLK
jgi:hypothetical protein